jgi:endo-1,4-beta-xylanase
LRRAALRAGLTYGCATATYQLDQPDFKAALLTQSAGLVAEYEMKRNAIEPGRGQFNFAPADRLVQFAQTHDLAFRGHTLVWYHSNPAWLEPAVRASRDERLFTDYITRVMRHYGPRVQSWDVVNEVLKPKDGRSDGLRKDFWLETFGPGFIDTAFHAARAAAPQAQLVYNDWGCELGGARHDLFRAKTLNLLEGLIARNVPIDALGLQGHLPAFGTTVDQAALRRFLDDVHAMGLKVLVTEHDVSDAHGPADIAARDRAVADASARFLDVVADHPATDAVFTWGLTDRFLPVYGWRNTLLGRRPRMLPLDDDLKTTAMWRSMRRAFAARRV